MSKTSCKWAHVYREKYHHIPFLVARPESDSGRSASIKLSVQALFSVRLLL